LPDKPAHILEISDALGRDVDRARAGTLKRALPVEAFMSDASLNEAERSMAALPVHQGDLVPISPAEAASRTTFDGESLPSLPKLRRVIPEPFRRERVSLDRHGRAWQNCRADLVAKGDVVPGVGRVVKTEHKISYGTVAGMSDVATGMSVVITGVGGNVLNLQPGDSVKAFRPAG
jgi:hypothetical protein